MAGFGTAPVGSTPFGFGTPEGASAPPVFLPEQANYLNPRTGDYEVEGDGGMKRMPIQRHRVLMLLSTALGSAAHEPLVGLRLPRKIDRSFVQKSQQAVRDALAPIGRDIRIDAIGVRVLGTGRAEITVGFTDMTTGNSDTVTI